MNWLTVSSRWIRRIPVGGALAALIPALATADPLRIDDAWVRAMPPGQTMTAAYLTLVNAGDRTVTVREAQADIAGRVSLHLTRRSGSRVTMQPAGWPTLAPGEALYLEPGGLHLMLEEIGEMPAPGDAVTLCLQTDGGRACVQAPVRRTATGGSGDHHHHGSASEG